MLKFVRRFFCAHWWERTGRGYTRDGRHVLHGRCLKCGKKLRIEAPAGVV